MPTYEYACSSCKHEWELEQSIKDNAITECPSCHQASAKRQISRGGGFILKGGGWYADAYSSASNKKDDKKVEAKTEDKPSATSGTPAASSEGSSASTPAASTSTTPAAASTTPAKSSSPPAT